MTDTKLLEVALCALLNYPLTEGKAIEAIRTRLAQPEPEAIAWMYIKKDGMPVITDDPDYADGTWTPLYTAPPKKEWVGLTEDERLEAIWESGEDGLTGDRFDVARAIEAKLKEKNI
jgi:hypothetical protein